MQFLLWQKCSTFLTTGRKKPLNFKLFIAAIFSFKFSKEFFSSGENFPPWVEKRRQMTIFLAYTQILSTSSGKKWTIFAKKVDIFIKHIQRNFFIRNLKLFFCDKFCLKIFQPFFPLAWCPSNSNLTHSVETPTETTGLTFL